uniref:(California timema) hypothetical protein n=1 Tax=Timema californicum TaxID=61474 RepID=A0A7R9JD90_TIMCA|nr:unnamed protein product [Timema californicum]
MGRELDGDETYIVLVNLGSETATVNVTQRFGKITDDLTVVTASIQSNYSRGLPLLEFSLYNYLSKAFAKLCGPNQFGPAF